MTVEVKQRGGLVVILCTSEHCIGWAANEYCGYEITIQNEDNTIRITGCYDSEPDFVDEFVKDA
ncbi:MAG TPA: hypothetical protein VMT97_09885 [Terriglobales bacterium]|nr:hypothetical protein [Terriglobales bacterium]